MLSLNVSSPEEISLVRCLEKLGNEYIGSRRRLANETNVTKHYPVEK